MLIEKYCTNRMTGNKISVRTIIREKKLKRLASKSYGVESKGKK